ncbi:F-box domain-containing protein [Artemisia annua]|uniref:F-box domain-containing protein n=1 Tax=Artemisia annua TaxID=35608 RepID=A0A2U1L6Z6_ARTAN|nr:F-box domain-containing protein [Artemisia annua]
MPDVPQDVLAEILSRLPVKSLLRFRTVSKHLCAVIDSPQFVNQHLNQSLKMNKILLHLKDSTLGSSNSKCSFYSFSTDPNPDYEKPGLPVNQSGPVYRIMGSFNGIICLTRGQSTRRDILFWNPSTKRYRLTKSVGNYPPGSKIRLTIVRAGYDHVSGDCKVVRFSHYSRPGSNLVCCKVNVYSLKLDLWQFEQEFPCNTYQVQGHDVCVSGSIHWVGTQNSGSNKKYSIIAFDLHSQSFKSVPQPKYTNGCVAIDLGILGGCLCVVCCHEKVSVDVWVMMKYGVKVSWRKLIALKMSDVGFRTSPGVRPISYLKNGKVLLQVDHKYFLEYDLEKKTSEKAFFFDAPYLTSCVYQETLVSCS